MKTKTKKQVIEGMIASNQEEIYRMEVVAAYKATMDTAEAKVQVDGANATIERNKKQIAWLKEHLKTLK